MDCEEVEGAGEYQCEKPCNKMKSCGRHRCNNRCCVVSVCGGEAVFVIADWVS